MEYWRTVISCESEHGVLGEQPCPVRILLAMLGSRARSSKHEEEVHEIERTEYIARMI